MIGIIAKTGINQIIQTPDLNLYELDKVRFCEMCCANSQSRMPGLAIGLPEHICALLGRTVGSNETQAVELFG